MFFSQTFLARKAPFGTIWCAAHLQRLKKSHYTSTDIKSTVDQIMFSEVPLALRLSGHLLLGVVRIYSKKVDYLHHDCNTVLISLNKAFTSIDLNLPEGAAQAPVHSITLPERFDLDAMELDDNLLDAHDYHIRNREDITLTEQIPTGKDVYIAITFDEDMFTDGLLHQQEIRSDVGPEDFQQAPPFDVDIVFQGADPNDMEVHNETVDAQEPGADVREETDPINQTAVDTQNQEESNQNEVPMDTAPIQDVGQSKPTEEQSATPEIPVPDPIGESSPEARRAAATPGSIPSLFHDPGNFPTEPIDQVLIHEKEIHTPILVDELPSGGPSSGFQHRSEAPPSSISHEVAEFDIRVSPEQASPQLELRSTPRVENQQKPRKRKRMLFDKSIVLSNAAVKKGLQDISDIKRERRKLPKSTLGLWRYNNSLRKERIFEEPLLPGLSADLGNIFQKDYISSKPHLVAVEEENTERMNVDEPAHETETVVDDRNLRSPDKAVETTIAESSGQAAEPIAESPGRATEAIPEPAVAELHSHATEAVPESDVEEMRHQSNIRHGLNEFIPSSSRRDDATTSPTYDFEPESAPRTATTVATDILPSPDMGPFTGSHSEFETPFTNISDQMGTEFPELGTLGEADELNFLEAGISSPGSQAKSNAGDVVDSLTVRSRAAAQYLKKISPVAPISEGVSEDPSGHLSLNKILSGKTRTICARMFYETLVLKSNGLIDVEQKEPYGDISLSLTQKLSKANI